MTIMAFHSDPVKCGCATVRRGVVPAHEVEVSLPQSKSVATRLCTLTFLSGGDMAGLLSRADCDDVRYLAEAFCRVSRHIRSGARGPLRLNLGEGAAPLRFFLAAMASVPDVEVEVECAPRLRRRPLSPLVDALRGLGAVVECLEEEGCVPLRIRGTLLPATDHIDIEGNATSQFVSALLMAFGCWQKRLSLLGEGRVLSLRTGELVSGPYVDMTLRMMERCGCHVATLHEDVSVCFRIDGIGGYQVPPYASPEADWTAASYFYLAAAFAPGLRVRMEGLLPMRDSLQRDSLICGLAASFGVHTDWSSGGSPVAVRSMHLRESPESDIERIRLTDTPDLMPTLAVGMAATGHPFEFTGISHLRHKESDRVSAVAGALRCLGWDPAESAGSLILRDAEARQVADAVVDVEADHRMAMAFAPLALLRGEIRLSDAEVVTKSFPTFWREMAKCGVVL